MWGATLRQPQKNILALSQQAVFAACLACLMLCPEKAVNIGLAEFRSLGKSPGTGLSFLPLPTNHTAKHGKEKMSEGIFVPYVTPLTSSVVVRCSEAEAALQCHFVRDFAVLKIVFLRFSLVCNAIRDTLRVILRQTEDDTQCLSWGGENPAP